METFYTTELLSQFGSLLNDDGTNPKMMQALQDGIRESIKFRVPDNGHILPEAAVGGATDVREVYAKYAQNQRLPYDFVVLEYKISDDIARLQHFDRCVVLLAQAPGISEIRGCTFVRSIGSEYAGRWAVSPSFFVDDYQIGSLGFKHINETCRDAVKDSSDPYGLMFLTSVARSVTVEFLVALACSNSAISDQPHNRKMINKKRQKKGKPPFYSYKVLTITQHGYSGGGDGASGRSPRVHLRRGHIRRLPSKTVWVNASVVGDKSKGLVAKDYTVPMRADLPDAANWPIHATQN